MKTERESTVREEVKSRLCLIKRERLGWAGVIRIGEKTIVAKEVAEKWYL